MKQKRQAGDHTELWFWPYNVGENSRFLDDPGSKQTPIRPFVMPERSVFTILSIPKSRLLLKEGTSSVWYEISRNRMKWYWLYSNK